VGIAENESRIDHWEAIYDFYPALILTTQGKSGEHHVKIAVVGTGYVGLVTGTCFSEFGVNTTCVDIDKSKIDMLNNGEIPIYEPGLKELVEKNVREDRLFFTTDIASAIRDALVVFIAVGTPPREDGTADLVYVDNVAKTVAENLNSYKVIVTKSTVPVGTGEHIRNIINEHKNNDVEFDVVSNPEFLREGSAINDFMRPDRVVIGASSERASDIMKELYRPLFLIETPFVITNVETSEMIKYASNAFLAVKISYINEVADLCERTGADVHKVAKAMGLDGRISPKFLHPGPGYGGSCFPKDTRAITQVAREHGMDMEVISSAVEVNVKRPYKMTEKILDAFEGDVTGKTIAILGLAFKPNTDDMREAPSVPIIKKLLEKGAIIKAFDPASMQEARHDLGDTITYCTNVDETVEGADGVVILTEWPQFRNLDINKLKSQLKSPLMVDLRNVYEPTKLVDAGFKYVCVGRPLVAFK
jgi:UDPglucose 6-dehydrogenase